MLYYDNVIVIKITITQFMSQHFLLSAKAKTLSLKSVMRMSDTEARQSFQNIRWHSTGGKPVCSRCSCLEVYDCKSESLFKCKGCGYRFSVTSGTIFASRKLPIRDLLAAIAIFVNSAKGISALQLSRDLSVAYQTAFVLAHKLREALSADIRDWKLSGEVEIDGCYVGGYVKPANIKVDRRDRRIKVNQSGKREVVVVMRERAGRTLPFVFKSEDAAVGTIRNRIEAGSIIHADEAAAWDALHASYPIKRINHSQAYSHDGACTNQAESFFSRLRRAEVGTYHHISGKYLGSYANEMAWRENNRRVSNGDQYLLVTNATLQAPVSRQWKGYGKRKAA